MSRYFEKGFVTKRELDEALQGASGGLSSWDPLTEPNKIQAGVYASPGSFVLLNEYTGFPIDDITATGRGTIIYFYETTLRWGIISAEDKYKGVYQTLVALQNAFPTASNGDYALVIATGTFFAWFDTSWVNTNSNVAPDALRSTNNFSDLTDFAIARTNLDVYSKSETITQINNGIFSNVNIATNANIETSKIKQTTITPSTTTPASNDTQDILNNKFTGNINELKVRFDNLPIGASSGDTLFLTNTNSSIIGYKELSKTPSTSPQVAITTTANNNEVLAASFVNPIQIGKTKLDAGIWQTNLFAYADHAGSCRVIAKFYKRVGTVETLLFQVSSPLIISVDSANPDVLSLETPQQEYIVNTTDLVVVKFFVSTTRTSNTNITFYHSGLNFFSHIHTPLVPLHNDLKGLQGGAIDEYYHLTEAKLNLVNDIPNRIPKVSGATVGNFASFNSDGNIIDSLKNSSSFEPADITILKQANIVNNLVSTSVVAPLSANMGKDLQDNKLNTADAPSLAISSVGGVLTDTNSIDFTYQASPQNIKADVKTANSSKVSLTTGATGIIADVVAGSLVNADINANANISTSKSQFTDALDPLATDNIAQNDLLSTVVKKVANLLPVNNTASGKYLSNNKTWSDLNQNAVGISSKIRKDGSDNIILSSQSTTDSGSQGNIDIRMGNTTTSSTKGGSLVLQASNGTAGSGDIVFKTSSLPNTIIEVGSKTDYTNSGVQNATFSHIVPADKINRLLIVSIITPPSSPATAVSYNGQAMTEISTGPVASTTVNVQTFYLISPQSGTANVIITRTTSGSIIANALNIANVNQTTPISNATETFSNTQATSASLTLTSTVSGQLAIGTIGTVSGNPSVGSGQTQIFLLTSNSTEIGSSSYKSVTTSTTSVSYTFASSTFAFHSFTLNQVDSTSLGEMQEVASINSQGIVANSIQKCSVFSTLQNISLIENSPTKLIFTSSVSGNSTVSLPNATRLVIGTCYEFINQNSNKITINNNNSSLLAEVSGVNQKLQLLLTNNSTSAGSWISGSDITTGSLANNFSNRKIVYLSQNGADSNNGYSPEGAVLTLPQALILAGNSGNQVEVLPGTYAGNYTITQQNVSIIGSNNEGRGLCNFTGTLTSNNSGASSQLLQGLNITNVVNTSAGGLYINNSTINTSLSNSTSGYLEVEHCDLGTATISITGSGNKNFVSCNGGIYTINNAGAIVNIKDNLTVVSPTVTAGILSISNATIYSLSNTATVNAIDVASGAFLYLSNVNIIRPDGNPAIIRTQAGSFYSFSNVNFDRVNSTLAGTNLSREFNFDNIRAEIVNGISNTVLQYISTLSSDAQNQINSKQSTNTNLTQISNLSTSGNKYKVIRLNATEDGVNYELAFLPLTTEERNNLTTPATGLIIYNTTSDKLQKYNGTGWDDIITAGTGNVSTSGLTNVAGKLAIFENSTGTTINSVSTASLVQKQSNAKDLRVPITLTTTELDSLTWSANDIVYNTTENRLVRYSLNNTWVDATPIVGDFKDTTYTSEVFGWRNCDGQAISRTDYPEAFIAIGTQFGSGDGSTTFNLPDFRSKVAGYVGTGVFTSTFLPSNINISNDIITVPPNSTLFSGTAVRFSTTGTLPQGISAGTTYYVIRLSATTINLATSIANVNVPTVFNFTNTGTGVGTGVHTLTTTLSTRTIGQNVGEEEHQLVTSELASHSHLQQAQAASGVGGTSDPLSQDAVHAADTTSPQSTNPNILNTAATGGNIKHNNIQPTLFINKQIFLGR